MYIHGAAISMSDVQLFNLDICVVDHSTPILVLESTLKSLQADLEIVTEMDVARVFLVDNGNRHAELRALASRVHGRAQIEVLSGHGNVGFGAGNNIALSRSASKYFLMLNPDVELFPSCLSNGLSFLESHSDSVMVVPCVVDSDGRRSYLCRSHPSIRALWNRAVSWPNFSNLNDMYELRHKDWSVPRDDFSVASGCFMLCRTDALRAVGGFDEHFFLYFEDYDLSLRLRKRGSIFFLPEMAIRHHGGGVVKKSWKHRQMFLFSALKFFYKHGWCW